MVNVLLFLVFLEQERQHYSNVLLEKSSPAQVELQSEDLMFQLLKVSNKLEKRLAIVHNLIAYSKV
jgi:hypothetical protein